MSSPAVTSDADGALTLAAVSRSGTVVHAWQQTGEPNDWEWGGAIGTGSPGKVSGDPAAVREPGGAVGVFVTTSGGTVLTARQTAANATQLDAVDRDRGGCASSPVPFSTGGAVWTLPA